MLEELLPLGVTHCGALFIPKASRHDEADHNTLVQVSHCSTEQALIAALPKRQTGIDHC